jgi:hypothetical protein
MNDTGTKKTTRILVAIVLMVFFQTTTSVYAAEPDLNSIPEPLRPEAARLVEKGIRVEDTLRLTHQFLDLKAEQKTISSAYQVIVNTLDNGLPPEPVLNKAFEGTAKKVSPDLIIAAMQKVMNRYQYAYQNVRKMLNVPKNRVQPLGNLASESMAAGLKPESLQEIFTALDQRAKTMPDDSAQHLFNAALLSARDMSRLGTSNQVVSETICEAMKIGMDGNGMMRFHDDFMNRGHNTGGSTGSRSSGSGFGQGGSGSGSGPGSGGGGGGGGGGSK